MLLIDPKLHELSIVIVGAFNPAIVQPGWLAKHGVIGETEGKNAEVEIIHGELTGLKFELFRVVVERERFMAATNDIHLEIIRDFVLKTFGELLPHTPVRGMGINYALHFECPSAEQREAIGERIAPKAGWGEWGQNISGDPDVASPKHGGLASITMKQNRREDGFNGSISVRLEPSLRVTNGIFMFVNDHYELSSHESDEMSPIVPILEQRWQSSINYSEFIINGIMKQVVARP